MDPLVLLNIVNKPKHKLKEIAYSERKVVKCFKLHLVSIFFLLSGWSDKQQARFTFCRIVLVRYLYQFLLCV